MRIYLACVLALVLAVDAFGQTATPATQVNLPTYIMGGLSYNQYTGGSGFVSAIVPESNSVGLYGSVTADVVPVKYVDATGKSGWLLSTSVRAGQHKVLYNDGKNMLLIGGDFGASFTQPNQASGLGTTTVPSSSGVTIGASGSFTATYVYQINAHLAVGIPIRMLWMSGAGPNGSGAWNPVAEIGVVWKP